MKAAHNFNPLRLDLQRLAGSGEVLNGQWPLAALERLSASTYRDEAGQAVQRDEPQVAWSASAETGPWLLLKAQCSLRLQCQRCLAAMQQPLSIDRRIRFVASEEEAERLDGEIEEDVMALAGRLNLQELVEDELILALPLVPSHELCPEAATTVKLAKLAPASNSTSEPADQAAAEHPFAALAQLRNRLPGH